MARVVIIGANSYIARNFIYQFKGSIELYLYDIQDEFIDGDSDYSKIDLLDISSISTINLECDLIYIFSGITGTEVGFEKYRDFLEVNEIGLLNILNEYRKQSSEAKIIFLSTRLVYKGTSGKLKEDAEKEFKTPYAMNKFSCENYLQMYSRLYGVKYIVLRLCIPYGTLLPNSTSYGTIGFFNTMGVSGKDITLYGDGNQRRTFIHIEDLCRVLLESGLNNSCLNDIYNIGGDSDMSLLEVANIIAMKYGVGIVHNEWPVNALKLESGDTVFDSTKLDNLLGFEYKHNFKEEQ